MTTATQPEMHAAERKDVELQLQILPRALTALGKDLVTDDIVAITELVKNSYDAFAQEVLVKLHMDENGEQSLEIRDDGLGMNRRTIEDQWCKIGTAYKRENPWARRAGKTRRVSGNKGLGRLSMARLGNRMTMVTQALGEKCWEVEANWATIAGSADMPTNGITLREARGGSPFDTSGTRITIQELSSEWSEGKRQELRENLRRLISPFAEASDFGITLDLAGEQEEGKLEAQTFLQTPKYAIRGEADSQGNIRAEYRRQPEGSSGITAAAKVTLSWSQVWEEETKRERWQFEHDRETAKCGGFSFEIRAWDIDTEGTKEIAEEYGLARRDIREAIRAHKGISIYRDGVLVLPKSDRNADWLGMNLRRVSNIGRRLSTSQIVGCISITEDGNPRIQDTTDRERLSANRETEEFESLVKYVLYEVEKRRNEQRAERRAAAPERTMTHLLENVSASRLIEETEALARDGEKAEAVVPLVRELETALADSREEIERRLSYYSRLAAIGTIAETLVHEIRNRTTAVGRFLKTAEKLLQAHPDDRAEQERKRAEKSVRILEDMADRFAPMANRKFKRGTRRSILEERMETCLDMRQGELKAHGITWSRPEGRTEARVDPGELDIILDNMIANATYWLRHCENPTPRMEFSIQECEDPERAELWLHDNGPGVAEEDKRRIFLAGVSGKPDGIGMGLTTAAEIVAAYGGSMRAECPGKLGGASFRLDLPLGREGTKKE